MPEPIIEVENISKLYRLGVIGTTTLQQSIERCWYRIRGKEEQLQKVGTKHLMIAPDDPQAGPEPNSIWALRDVSFSVQKGEIIGIIGKNGAGKSTLLKILTRITEPTSGRAIIDGRVASLLEVGTGFHPELTGRENVYLNGAILGMRKAEIDNKFDEIVEFSGIENFIDTPVKRYSSGMYVRLAFAVAAHLEPEILLVDEVLAVGDIEFQKKCLGKMKDVAEGGRTVLFVSHNMGAITTLCERGILLTEGRIDFMGTAQETVSTYLATFTEDACLKREWSCEEAFGGETVKVLSIGICDHQGVAKTHFSTTEPIFVTVEYLILEDNVPVNVYFGLYDEKDNCICVVGNHNETRSKPIKKSGLYMSKCVIPGYFLNSGRYMISLDMIRNITEFDVRLPRCVGFETVDDQRVHSSYSKWAGLVKPEFEWQSKRLGTGIA